jgi:lysophospholipase L1-like esterase
MCKNVILLVGTFLLCTCASAPAGINENARLQQTLAKLRRGETVSIVAIGGSITTGHQARPPESAGWAAHVKRWWQEKAGQTGGKVNFYNSGASGTDSAFASIRIQEHALQYEPDLVIVEFAINDQWLSSRVRQRSFEGVLRQLLADSQRSVIILSLNEKAYPEKSTFREQERIGRHYGIPVLAWAQWVKFSQWDTYFNGSEAIHPNNEGHANIASGITGYLDAAWNSLPESPPSVNTVLPPPLVSAEFQNVRLIGGTDTDAMINLDTSLWQSAPAILPGEWSNTLTGWTTDDVKADLSIRVQGKSVGLLFAESDQFINGSAWIDSPEPKKVVIRNFVSYRAGYYGYAYAEVADNLDPLKEHILHLAVNSGGKQGSTHIIGVVCTGQN